MAYNGLDVRGFDYFSFGNIFTGSQGERRYRLAPGEEGLEVWVWQDGLCFEKCAVTRHRMFPLTPQGLEEAMEWIGEEPGEPI